MPKEFRKLWFNSYQSVATKDMLFLQMERIYKDPITKIGGFVDLLTFEITDIQILLEWEEDFPDKPFVASDPYYIFYDGLDDKKQGMFSIGDLDLDTMEFTPELEIFLAIEEDYITLDFDDGEVPELWTKMKKETTKTI